MTAGNRLELWRCSALRALVSESQCSTNKQRAKAPERSVVGMDGYRMSRALADALVGLSACRECAGVRSLSRRPERVLAVAGKPAAPRKKGGKRAGPIKPGTRFVRRREEVLTLPKEVAP